MIELNFLHSEKDLIDKDGKRIDGRGLYDLRPLRLDVGFLNKAEGSAYIEQGKNRILAAVYGPREAHPKHIALPHRAVVRCRYHMAPFSVDERKSPAPSRREHEILFHRSEGTQNRLMSHADN